MLLHARESFIKNLFQISTPIKAGKDLYSFSFDPVNQAPGGEEQFPKGKTPDARQLWRSPSPVRVFL